jgi:hypothetical protein
MRKIDEIKNMDVEQLAKFLICESAYEDIDYDWEEEPYSTIRSCYVTPFYEYDYWEDYETVLEDTVRRLLEDENGSIK